MFIVIDRGEYMAKDKKTKEQKEPINKKVKVTDIKTEEKINIKDNDQKSITFGSVILFILIMITIGFYGREYYHRLKAHNRIIKQNLEAYEEGLHFDAMAMSLHKDEPFTSNYYFKGGNVNNYLIYSDICWQIVNIANNDAIKLIYLGPANDKTCNNVKIPTEMMKWDNHQNNEWSNSSLQKTFDKWVNDNKIFDHNIDFTSANSKIIDATWYIGGVEFPNRDTREAVKREHYDFETGEKTEYKGKIGLINLTDYLKATTSCNYSGAYFFDSSCGEKNYLYQNNNYWLLNKTLGDNVHVWTVDKGGVESKKADNDKYLVLPSVYLKPNTLLKGKGTINKPYIVMDSIYDLFNIWG